MSKLNVKIVTPLPEPMEGKEYTIIDAERITTARQHLDGIRVVLEDDEKNRYGTMIWLREQATPSSKLGAFVMALGDDISLWKGKTIRIVSWSQRNRKIVAVEKRKK